MNRSMFQGMFFNPFANKNYSLVGLCLFGSAAHPALLREFPGAAAGIAAAIESATQESAEVALALGEQKSLTGSVDGFLERFPGVLGDLQDKISAALGGRRSEGFLAFYPNGLDEYHKLAKKNAPAVMRRLSLAVNSYGAALDGHTKSTLLQLEADWTVARGKQVGKKRSVTTNRSERQDARTLVEAALWRACREVLDRYTGQPEKCLGYFQEHLLQEAPPATVAVVAAP